MSEPWLKKREIAQRYKVSPRTIERWGVPHQKIGGQNRYLASVADAHFEAISQGCDVAAFGDNVIAFPKGSA